MIGLIVSGIIEMRRRSHSTSHLPINFVSIFFAIILLQLCFGLGSVLYERKFFVYHFQRIYWCLAPIAAIGIDRMRSFNMIGKLRMSIVNFKFSKRLLLPSFLFLLTLLYSPLGRLGYHPLRWAWLVVTCNDSAKYAILKHDGYDAQTMKQVADYISKKSHPEDQVFLWVYSVEIYFFLNRLPITICLANLHFVAPWSPIEWKTTVIRQLKKTSPRFFVSECNDSNPSISGTSLDSYQSLLQWEELRAYLFTNYALRDSTDHFKIYERVKDSEYTLIK
jgi:hypothetical protein